MESLKAKCICNYLENQIKVCFLKKVTNSFNPLIVQDSSHEKKLTTLALHKQNTQNIIAMNDMMVLN